MNGVNIVVPNLSQLITPGWQHPATYSRLGSNVIEMPLGNNGSINMALSNQPGGKAVYKNAYSRSSFLLLKDSTGYNAYVMTIIADSSYLKNDLTKLDHNKYNKHDSDFSGVVLYFTPKGKFLSGWFYKNGSISGALSSTQTTYTLINTPGNGLTTQSLQTNELSAITTCQYWYQTVTAGGVTYGPTLLDESCTTTYYDSGGSTSTGTTGTSGNSGSSPSTPIPCTVPGSSASAAVSNGHLIIDVAQPQPTPIGSTGDGGYPPPTTTPTPCPTSTTTTTTSTLKIDVDSLQKNFPCAVKLIINNLGECGTYGNWIQPFTTAKKPNLVWQNGTLPWGTSNGSYVLGVTSPELGSPGLGATITLNTSMLQKGSQLLISAAAVHETLHAFINYNVSMAVDDKANGYMTTGSWLYGLDAWIHINGLPSNYSNHYEMLSNYFSDAVGILAQLDNNAHTTQDYAMAMLFGLDNATDGTPAQQAVLQTEYNNIMTAYGITATQLAAFNKANLNAPSSSQLPTNCN